MPREKGVEVELRDIIGSNTTRGLDFVTIDELRNGTGVNPDSDLKFVKLVWNPLSPKEGGQ